MSLTHHHPIHYHSTHHKTQALLDIMSTHQTPLQQKTPPLPPSSFHEMAISGKIMLLISFLAWIYIIALILSTLEAILLRRRHLADEKRGRHSHPKRLRYIQHFTIWVPGFGYARAEVDDVEAVCKNMPQGLKVLAKEVRRAERRLEAARTKITVYKQLQDWLKGGDTGDVLPRHSEV